MTKLQEAHDKILAIMKEYDFMGSVSLVRDMNVLQIIYLHNSDTVFLPVVHPVDFGSSLLSIENAIHPPLQISALEHERKKQYLRQIRLTGVYLQSLTNLEKNALDTIKQYTKMYINKFEKPLNKALKDAEEQSDS